ncbi:DUF2953 family protein [Anaerobacterium chartisolvens]|uniref:DUF2953 family protein n=1 Tax=Anaerobacterium chartisolvens TaxID=1297424 RepID=A0A369B511_9FIRM|nr:DUF2953 domain-containing protein [Anaerobacterium chartisolvens]RCX16573.1 DUF2953 family protein [Anaerobacterium chartisolvens]
MFLVSILGYALLGIAVLVACIIFIPYKYYISGKKLDESYVKGSVCWLFGAVKINFFKGEGKDSETTVKAFGIERRLKPGKSKEHAKKDSKQKTNSAKKYMKPEVIKKAVDAAFKIFKHCMPARFYVNARAGFEDPALTGMLCAVNAMAWGEFKGVRVRINAVFDDEVIEGRFLIGGRIWVAYLILVAIGTIITRPFRDIWMNDFKTKIKGGV